MTQKILRVGILTAASQPIQNFYLPVLRALPQYQVIIIYDSSSNQPPCKDDIPLAPDPQSVISNPAVDLVLNFMPNEFHETYTIAALAAGKHVMVETPVSMSVQSGRRIVEAEKRAPNGTKVFVASARRYAPCFELFKREVASLDRIYYARCRNIAGPHAAHTATAPEKEKDRKDWTAAGGLEKGQDGAALAHELLEEVFCGQELTAERMTLARFLTSLGCHDLGLMRDTLGYPDAISNISVNDPFYAAAFHYKGGKYSGGYGYDDEGDGCDGHHPFTLMYETGTDSVPRCDAHLAVYGSTKTVTIHYGLPYGQGMPVRVVVETMGERGKLKTTENVSDLDEVYQAELEALHAFLAEGKPAKTTAGDSLRDLKLFQTIYEQYDRQCGRIRTPLG